MNNKELTVIKELKSAISDLTKGKSQELVAKVGELPDTKYLRFYYDSESKIATATEELHDHLFFLVKQEKISSSIMTVNDGILGSGAFYSHGRDCALRPIIVFNFTKVINIINKVHSQPIKIVLKLNS